MKGPTGDGCQALFHKRSRAVDKARGLRAVLAGSTRHRGNVRLVVLANVGRVGERDGSLFPHPCHRDGRIETTGERNSYPFTNRKLREDFGHSAQPRTLRPSHHPRNTAGTESTVDIVGSKLCLTARAAFPIRYPDNAHYVGVLPFPMGTDSGLWCLPSGRGPLSVASPQRPAQEPTGDRVRL